MENDIIDQQRHGTFLNLRQLASTQRLLPLQMQRQRNKHLTNATSFVKKAVWSSLQLDTCGLQE